MLERKNYLFGAVAVGAFVWLKRRPALGLEKPITRSLTVLASIAEIEFFLLDTPAPELMLTLKPAPGAGTEVHARLDRWSGDRATVEHDVIVWLRRLKQLIEAGEVARIDSRVRGAHT